MMILGMVRYNPAISSSSLFGAISVNFVQEMSHKQLFTHL